MLDLETLEMRRLKADLILAYKILFGLINLNANDFFSLPSTDNYTRGHAYRLSKSDSNSNVQLQFFCNRILNVWNNLPDSTTDFTALNNFKSSVGLSDEYLIKFCTIKQI